MQVDLLQLAYKHRKWLPLARCLPQRMSDTEVRFDLFPMVGFDRLGCPTTLLDMFLMTTDIEASISNNNIQTQILLFISLALLKPSLPDFKVKQPIDLPSNMSSPKEVRWGILATGGIAQTLYVT